MTYGRENVIKYSAYTCDRGGLTI